MAKKIARILLISDFHWMVVPPGQQKGQIIKGFSRIVEGVINIWKRWNVPNVRKALSKISAMGEFDLAISNGDIAECVYNERGIITQEDIKALRDLKQYLEGQIRLSSPNIVSTIRYNSGDHELGYKLPLSVDPNGGISQTSFENFHNIFGPFFQKFSWGSEFHFILLCSSLLIQETNHLREAEKNYVDNLKKKQAEFLQNYLDDAEHKNVFIFLHDPDAIEIIDPILEKYPQKRFKVFCGHLHAEESLKDYEQLGRIANSRLAKIISLYSKGKKIMEWAKGNLQRLEIFKKYNLQIILATGGMMGKGGGFLILNLFDDGSYQIEKHKT